tara:strand:- start:22313 stop:22528 length:216 start_codon:yes stop_codon:yes gene_type:complete
VILSILAGGHKMTNLELTKLVEQQQDVINQLVSRVSTLSDDLTIMKGSVESFKGMVTNDMKRVVEVLKTKR